MTVNYTNNMSNLTITQAAAVCGYERSYFYKFIKKNNLSIKKDFSGKSYIDVSELVRIVPSENLNLPLLEEFTGQQIDTLRHNTETQKTTEETTLITQLKSELDFVKKQLEINQQQIASLLDTVNKQTLLLENKTTLGHNTETQKTTEETTLNKSEIKSLLDNLRKK